MDTDLLEQSAAAEEAAGATATAGRSRPRLVGAGDRLPGRPRGGRLALQQLDLGANPVAQRFEPYFRFGALLFGETVSAVADGLGPVHPICSIGRRPCAATDRGVRAARTGR